MILIGLGLAGVAWTATACSEDLVEIPEELRGEPACAWVIDSFVHFEGDNLRVLYDEQTGWSGAACLCLTEEQFESRSRDAEFNDLALDICNKLAAQHEFIWNDCQMDYESERWLDFVYWAVEDFEHPSAERLGCVGE
jgi:hypothetical protein